MQCDALWFAPFGTSRCSLELGHYGLHQYPVPNEAMGYHAPGSYPDYFLCEVELLAEPALGRPENRARRDRNPSYGASSTLFVIRRSPDDKHLHVQHGITNTACATGGWRGGRRVSMPGLRRVVSSASDLPRPGESGIPAAAAVGQEYARSHDRDLPAVRADVDDPFAQIRGAVHRAARPALSASSATSEASACSPE
jgi:hypothetical protein